MQQISIFDELRKVQEHLEIFFKYGCTYAVVPDNYPLDKSPVALGGINLIPGMKISYIGNGIQRTSFEMQEGRYLQYEGKHPDNFRYVFHYIDEVSLFVMSGRSTGWDIKAEKIKMFA